jgi:predicted MPP superfamily phosphohydrolase
MYEWLLINVFPTPKEKAILISMVVSTILAIAVFFLNKWANDSREKKKHLILKLEELSKLTSEYSVSGMHYVQDGINQSDEEKSNSILSKRNVSFKYNGCSLIP